MDLQKRGGKSCYNHPPGPGPLHSPHPGCLPSAQRRSPPGSKPQGLRRPVGPPGVSGGGGRAMERRHGADQLQALQARASRCMRRRSAPRGSRVVNSWFGPRMQGPQSTSPFEAERVWDTSNPCRSTPKSPRSLVRRRARGKHHF